MAKSLCHLLMLVNHANGAIYNIKFIESFACILLKSPMNFRLCSIDLASMHLQRLTSMTGIYGVAVEYRRIKVLSKYIQNTVHVKVHKATVVCESSKYANNLNMTFTK